MKNPAIVILLLASLVISNRAQSATVPIQDETPDAVNLFYADLGPYGEWIEFGPGIYGWHPLNVEAGWRPYTSGRWVWSDYGWYWVTAEPFGWATYHYGRWYLDEAYGWMWIPDTMWGPAWVEWRSNDDFVGWAPLPPYARFHVTVGIRFTRRWAAPPSYWSFVSINHFVSARPYHTYVSLENTRRLVSTTRSTGRYQIDRNRIIDQGIERNFIQSRTSSRIEDVEVHETHERGIERISSDGLRERIDVYRPRPGEAETFRGTIVTRRAQTRPSVDLERVEQYPSSPKPHGRALRGSNLQSQQGTDLPSEQLQPRDRHNRDLSRPDMRRDRLLRSQPQMPGPRIDRSIPRREKDNRHENRNGGRGRDRF